jgi:hypothetical protein
VRSAGENEGKSGGSLFHGGATISHAGYRVNRIGMSGVTIGTMATPGGLDP